ncbi:MAG: branched-chain amino acid ABC transporter ATP-binding protein/permease [Deltaproteobacteria bacterium]|nr:branched-chain amino acid ABC transporter ATP-binding protein/permease [Deltaproteobacteria bacterium]
MILPFLMVQLKSTISIANEILIFTTLILGFNILLGYTGLLSFGHGAFFGLGAYLCGLSQIHLFKGMVLLPILCGVLGATIAGVIIGFLLMRKRGVYFSLLTFAFTMMFFYIVFRATAVTGGENGLGGIERYPLNLIFFQVDLSNQLAFYYFCWIWVVLSTLLIWRIVHSPFGHVLQAIRENEVRTLCLGYNPRHYKFMAFVLSTVFGGLTGALYALLLNFAYPQTMHVATSGEIAAMALVGGMRNFFGPIVGSSLFIFLRDILSSFTENWLVFFGVIFMGFVLFSFNGIVGILVDLVASFRQKQEAVSAPAPSGNPGTPVVPEEEEKVQVSAAVYQPSGNVVFALQGVSKHFGALAAVDGVTLEVEKGELRSIIGPNGAGKTTLFNVITGLLPIDGGQVKFKGEEITGLMPNQVVAKGVSRSFQIISIFQDLTVFENLRVAVQARTPHRFNFFSITEELEEINQEADRIIATVGLIGREGMKASSLSHGDQRLLEIGLSLATNPEMLLLDEPLAGLSPRERTRVAKLIKQLSGEHTLLLIEHDIDRVLSLSDRITVLNQGKVIAEGTPQEIQQNPKVQEAYLAGFYLEEKAAVSTAPAALADPLLQVSGINTYYGKSHILHNVSFTVNRGEVVCLLGRNGAGKTTTLTSIMGITPPRSGKVVFRRETISGLNAESIARKGLGLVPQGRRIFPNLTVLENLTIASKQGQGIKSWDVERALELFPKLQELRNRRGETLSGGELQMLAIARTLMGNVDLLLLDEPFEGLAPTVVENVRKTIEKIRGETTLLLVEQNASLTLTLANRAYVLNNGMIEYDGLAADLLNDRSLRVRLLGV